MNKPSVGLTLVTCDLPKESALASIATGVIEATAKNIVTDIWTNFSTCEGTTG